MSLAPVQIFQDQATEERAENARLSSFIGAIAVGDLVKSTLGPKGMDKILQSATTGEILVTNDGATILKSIALDNAAAKVLVNISKVQDDEVGDGTTSVCVLAAELLREAERLVNQRIHPQTIIEGYRIASQAAYDTLEASAIDHSLDKALFRQDLINIAKTTLSSKVLSQDKEYFSELAVDAVLRLKGSTNLENIQIIKKPGGKLMDSYLDEGFILDKKIGVNCPKRIENAKILIANTPMDTDKIKIFGARVRVDSTGKLADLERAERDKMKAKEPRTVLGGGCSEMLMSKAVDEIATKIAGKQAIAAESFAKALRQMPTILADNAGFDSSELVAQLRAAQYKGDATAGLDMVNGEVANVRELGITESFKLKKQVLLSASEAAEMILRVDDIIRCAPRQRQG
ncbi:hypothetical protein [Absidia glauca]|uniref:Uncharacterized protein n=1 Tax=Absidia glauca TaxID=4829 RepID=A0A163JI24_ABSGL|nr:hypothetical protein [Absidia glauca]